MGNKITQWHAELHKDPDSEGIYKCYIYNQKEQLVDEITTQDWDSLVDGMRESLVAHVREEYGATAGHELTYSSQIGDQVFDIPVTIVDMPKSVVGSNPNGYTNDTDEPRKDTVNTHNLSNVSFTPATPTRNGYYFFTPDGKESSVTVMKVIVKEENIIAFGFETVGAFPVDDWGEENALWSKNPIRIPPIDANSEKPVVDHEDW